MLEELVIPIAIRIFDDRAGLMVIDLQPPFPDVRCKRAVLADHFH